MTDDSQSLRSLYDDAQRLRSSLDQTSGSSSIPFQDTLSQALALYEQCLKVSQQVSLFSPNESLEDVSTGDLPSVARAGGLDMAEELPVTS